MTATTVPMVDLAAQRARLGSRIETAIAGVLDHGRFVSGPEVAELEDALAAHCGARNAISCGSGTDALVIALMAAGVGPGDVVFVPGFTFAATASSVLLVGATPVLVDVLGDTFDLDPAALDIAVDAITRADGLRAKAVMPVDLFGQPADYEAIGRVAAAHELFVLADAAQSFGATSSDGPVGTLGDCTATSFFPSKPLGCYGEGGALFTEDDELAAALRLIRSHGEGRERYEHLRLGLNARLDTIQAAVLLQKLEIFDDELKARDAVASRYTAAFSGRVRIPRVRLGATSTWAQYTVVVDNRAEVIARLTKAGIASAIHYPRPLDQQPAFAGVPCAPGGLPVSEALAGSVLSLPMHPYLDESSQDRVITALLGDA